MELVLRSAEQHLSSFLPSLFLLWTQATTLKMVNYSIIHVQTLLYHNSQNLAIHTFAVLRGTENYEVLRDGLKPVIDEINELIDKGSVVLSNKRVVDVNIFLGGDYK